MARFRCSRQILALREWNPQALCTSWKSPQQQLLPPATHRARLRSQLGSLAVSCRPSTLPLRRDCRRPIDWVRYTSERTRAAVRTTPCRWGSIGLCQCFPGQRLQKWPGTCRRGLSGGILRSPSRRMLALSPRSPRAILSVNVTAPIRSLDST